MKGNKFYYILLSLDTLAGYKSANYPLFTLS